ncbi:acyltransferase [Algibacter sp. L4_22]|uniref:acyltransferase n=1 Tax=Algibacter sp. L4_22 TaxID=2942477 RepID=UPI00201B4B08|nr:acyltransferase [Algibacter sp. L4_22]MCL5129860.1 acyltransferase [Algibacter sp. L4_22]
MIQKLFYILVKAKRKIIKIVTCYFEQIYCKIILYGQNVKFKKISSNGIPYVMVAIGGSFSIGDNFKMNNGLKGNPIGRPQKCTFIVDKNAELVIGNNVGISQVAIVCHSRIIIGDNVKIGGGVCIYDTDFHSLDSNIRNDDKEDRDNKINLPIEIKKNAFIGAHTTILKGVIIGENAIVGACSLIANDIPSNEIWAGNPARLIKKI